MLIGRRRSSIEPGLIIGTIFILIATAGLGFFLFSPNPMKGINEQTFCRVDGDRSRTVVILDVTDTLSAVQQQTIRNRLIEIQNGIARFDRVDVFLIGQETQTQLESIVTACNPGNPSQVDELTTGLKFIAEKYRTIFFEPLDLVFKNTLQAPEAQKSPIIESIQAEAVTTFDAEPKNRGRVGMTLIIISDMLQNSSALSMYREIPSFRTFAALPDFRTLGANLKGVQVEVLVIPRKTALNITDKKLSEFWDEYFQAQGATMYRWKNL